MKFIIEHLDPNVFPWSLLEYTNISNVVGKENLIFTNVKKDKSKLEPLGETHKQSAKELNLKQETVCILDPFAEKELQPSDKFDYFLFGGVLGNDPMDGRTKDQISNNFPKAQKRRLGDKQMSTDTAVKVTHTILKEKIPFKDLIFADDLEIVFSQGYSQILPYRYLIENDKVLLTPGLIQLLKEEDKE